MKRSILIIGLSCFHLLSLGQNLIENGNFEDGNYNVPPNMYPVDYYSAENVGYCNEADRFNNDIDKWWVADPSSIFTCPGSPDWVPAGIVTDGFCEGHNSYYVRSASYKESIMTELKNGTTLEKGETYHFRTKVRAAEGWSEGVGSFQIVFSTIDKGLEVWPFNKRKWEAKSVFVEHSCYWKTIDTYFTVPNDDEHHYEDMKYMVLQYNYENDASQSLSLHYDDVHLWKEEECRDVKYIQNREYINESKIVQANNHIYAGENIDPNGGTTGPVIVSNGTDWSTNPAEIIYRAPNITLYPGFEVEEGAYFETQFSECTEDPCPDIIPYDNPGIIDLCQEDLTLGESLDQGDGIFFEWQPYQYFSNPNSPITNFIKPTGNGCVEAYLKIRTICGEEEYFHFDINYIEAPVDMDISNVLIDEYNIQFDIDIYNANSYSIQAINTDNNELVYENAFDAICGAVDLSEQISLTSCTHNLCGDIDVSINAENQCFGSQEELLSYTGSTIPNPNIELENVLIGDHDFSFDIVNIHNDFEYIFIELFKNGVAVPQCSQTIYGCDDPNLNTFHFDAENCWCLKQCKTYVVQISMKNRCNETIDTEVLTRNFGSGNLQVEVWPNVFSPNGDGINDCLQFNVQGADTYEIRIDDNEELILDEIGCVDEYPICLWSPPTNIEGGLYSHNYWVEFRNNCGQSMDYYGMLSVFSSGGMITNPNDELQRSDHSLQNSDLNQIQELEEQISVFPNPANETINIQGIPMPVTLDILDTKGKVLHDKIESFGQVDVKSLSSGMYFLRISFENRAIMKEFIKQ